LIFLGAALLPFVIAADEQSMVSNGLPTPDVIRLQDLMARGPGKNNHIELTDFYFGKQYIYTAKLVQFRDVYVPEFPQGQPENGSHLQLLLWIRNDRNSNQPLIENEQELDRMMAEFRRNPRTVTGILRKPTDRVRTLTVEAYPGTNPAALQVLWARQFPQPAGYNPFAMGHVRSLFDCGRSLPYRLQTNVQVSAELTLSRAIVDHSAWILGGGQLSASWAVFGKAPEPVLA
jgi:hypothetical protein